MKILETAAYYTEHDAELNKEEKVKYEEEQAKDAALEKEKKWLINIDLGYLTGKMIYFKLKSMESSS